MSLPGPTKATVLACTVNGADFTTRCLKISVFETVCKPYITGVLVVRDDNNVINNLGLRGGEPISFNFSAGDGLTYDMTLYLLKMQGEPMNNNLRSVKYTIDMIGPEYYADRVNMVQQSFTQMPATAIAQAIQGQYIGSGLDVPRPSVGMFGDKNPYVVNSVKPFKAINDLRKIMNFGNSGSSVYYRDRYQVHLTEVQTLFAQMGSQYFFEQRNTWGSDWHNVLGAYNAILAAATDVNEGQGRGGAQLRSLTSQFERKVRDLFSTKRAFLDQLSGGHGGLQNFSVFDSTVFPKEAVRNTGADMAYQAQIVDGPQVTIKVPLQTGILCTVGKGVTIKLIPPSGDLETMVSFERNNGNKLVADLNHAVETGEQGIMGTTTMRLVSPPGT